MEKKASMRLAVKGRREPTKGRIRRGCRGSCPWGKRRQPELAAEGQESGGEVP